MKELETEIDQLKKAIGDLDEMKKRKVEMEYRHTQLLQEQANLMNVNAVTLEEQAPEIKQLISELAQVQKEAQDEEDHQIRILNNIEILFKQNDQKGNETSVLRKQIDLFD